MSMNFGVTIQPPFLPSLMLSLWLSKHSPHSQKYGQFPKFLSVKEGRKWGIWERTISTSGYAFSIPAGRAGNFRAYVKLGREFGPGRVIFPISPLLRIDVCSSPWLPSLRKDLCTYSTFCLYIHMHARKRTWTDSLQLWIFSWLKIAQNGKRYFPLKKIKIRRKTTARWRCGIRNTASPPCNYASCCPSMVPDMPRKYMG